MLCDDSNPIHSQNSSDSETRVSDLQKIISDKIFYQNTESKISLANIIQLNQSSRSNLQIPQMLENDDVALRDELIDGLIITNNYDAFINFIRHNEKFADK